MGTWLVTGGAGFIGSHLVKRLVTTGNAVTVLDNFSNGTESTLVSVRSLINLIHGDIRSNRDLDNIMAGIDVVVHLAALGSVHRCQSEALEAADTNVLGTLRLLQHAKEARTGRFVYISSSTVYGTQPRLPLSEDMNPNPISIYGITKLSAELLVKSYQELYGLQTVILRPFSVFGPGQRYMIEAPRPIPCFVEYRPEDPPIIITGDGTQTRDFTYVSDIVDGIILAGTRDEAIGQTFNLASGTRHNLLELIEIIEKLKNEHVSVVASPRKPIEMWDTWADISRARQLLGFSPQYTLIEGLKQTIAWYRSL